MVVFHPPGMGGGGRLLADPAPLSTKIFLLKGGSIEEAGRKDPEIGESKWSSQDRSGGGKIVERR